MSKEVLSAKDRKRILADLSETQVSLGMSNALIARIVGVSRGLLSQLKSGAYTGDADRYLRIIRAWLDNRRDRVEIQPTDYVSTSIGEQILTVCDLAAEQPCIGLVKTPSGCGKTSALREAAVRLGPARCCYLQAGEATAWRGDLLRELADRLGCSYAGGKSQRLYHLICNRLAGYYSGGQGESYTILIDEATTLRANTINLLRNLHDEPACRPGIVLADTTARLDAMLYSRRRDGIVGGNEQLRSRAKAQFILPADAEISRADVKAVAESALAALGCKRKLSTRSIQYLQTLACKPGALRNVTARLQNVHFVATRSDVTPEYTVTQLDYVGKLSGDEWQMVHEVSPFEGNKRTA